MTQILINSEFMNIMHTLNEIPQAIAIHGQLITLTSICRHRGEKKPRKITNDVHLRKEGKEGSIQWLATDSTAYSVGEE